MGYLSGKRVYLSGPIENCKDSTNWRVEVKRQLKSRFGLDIFDPFESEKEMLFKDLIEARYAKNYNRMREIMKAYVRSDLAYLDRSDIVIARLPKSVPTAGTHHEIINSNNQKKPTLLVCPDGKEFVPLWYFGFIDHNCMFGSFEDLYSYLSQVENGLHKSNYRWSFIYGSI